MELYMSLRLLVSGSRDFRWSRKQEIYTVLDRYLTMCGEPSWEMAVIHGEAKGVDTIADRWARNNGIRVFSRPADWKRWGMAAGPKRNQELLTYLPTHCVAWPEKDDPGPYGTGSGTWNMIHKARNAGIPTEVFW